MADVINRYRFSFTAGALLHEEIVKSANTLIDESIKIDRLLPKILNKDHGNTNHKNI